MLLMSLYSRWNWIALEFCGRYTLHDRDNNIVFLLHPVGLKTSFSSLDCPCVRTRGH